jgi:hypothetical protein
MAQLEAKNTGWSKDLLRIFDNFESFKTWYDPIYKGMKAEDVWREIGGKLPKKEKKE